MILLQILLGVVLAMLIARYNESNKLFWILFTSFVLGIAGQSVYEIATSDSKASDSKSAFVMPSTQSLNHVITIIGNVTDDVKKNPTHEAKLCESEVHHEEKCTPRIDNDNTQPLIQPPRSDCIMFNTS